MYLVQPNYTFLSLLKNFDLLAGIYTKRYTKQQTVTASFTDFNFTNTPEVGEVIHCQIYFDYSQAFKIGIKGVFHLENVFTGQTRPLGSIRALFVVVGQQRQRLASLGTPIERINVPLPKENSEVTRNYSIEEKHLNTIGVVFGGKSLTWLLEDYLSKWELDKINNILVINFDNPLHMNDSPIKESYNDQILIKVNNVCCLAVHLKPRL
jgi:acyl-CoA hydrolase